MPRRNVPPSYRLHKARNCAVVTIHGRNHYLGRYGSEESYERYARLIAQWRPDGPSQTGCHSSIGSLTALSVTELIALYWQHALGYYIKAGEPSNHLANIRAAVRVLRSQYGATRAADFGPLALKAIQGHLSREGKARTYINSLCGNIRRVFKWAAAEELLPITVYQALSAAGGIKKGRSAARETSPIGPVDDAVVAATLPHLSPIVADMVRFQRLTGCRPGEVCLLRPADLDTKGAIWAYRPSRHKTEHHGRERVILIGPRAQQLLRPYLDRSQESHCFSPAESVGRRYAQLREKRRSKVQPSQASRAKSCPKKKPGSRYTKDSYGWAIRRACDRADRAAHESAPEVAIQQRLVPRWHPNQLRHSAATEIRRQFGLETAQACLGHSKASTTEIYAERNMSLAAEAMALLG